MSTFEPTTDQPAAAVLAPGTRVTIDGVAMDVQQELGEGFTAKVFLVSLPEDPDADPATPESAAASSDTRFLALKLKKADVAADVQIAVPHVTATNRCHCCPYVWEQYEGSDGTAVVPGFGNAYVVMEYIDGSRTLSDLAVNCIHKDNTYSTDTVIDLAAVLLRNLKELHAVGMDYTDVHDRNVSIETNAAALNGKPGRRSPPVRAVRFFDHGAISPFGEKLPHISAKNRSFAAITDDNFRFCTGPGVWQKDDSACSVLFMLLELVSILPWKYGTIMENTTTTVAAAKQNYGVFNKLRTLPSDPPRSAATKFKFSESAWKTEMRTVKDKIKYNIFRALLERIFAKELEEGTLTWQLIAQTLRDNFFGVLDDMFHPHGSRARFITALYLLGLWSAAQVKTTTTAADRDLDFIINTLNSLRSRPRDALGFALVCDTSAKRNRVDTVTDKNRMFAAIPSTLLAPGTSPDVADAAAAPQAQAQSQAQPSRRQPTATTTTTTYHRQTAQPRRQPQPQPQA